MVSRILKEPHDIARDMYRIGTLDTTTMRAFDATCLLPAKKLSASQINSLRISCKQSQPVFAAYVNINPSTVRQWENGD
jgi:putative transcriptional regulator